MGDGQLASSSKSSHHGAGPLGFADRSPLHHHLARDLRRAGSTLAAVGTYGVMSYSVAERTGEIGIRMAMGADTGRVLRLVLSQGLRLAVIGLALGLALAFVFTRFLSSFLFGVSQTDLVTFGSVPAVLLVVALLACLVPAFRATRVDPVTALRHE